MLMDRIRYAFLVSVDEIIFLRCDVVQKVETVNVAPRGRAPDLDQAEVLMEPWLYYSDPIKFTDTLDETKGTVPVRLALLYLMHTSTGSDWKMPNELGSCLKYMAKTKAGEKWKPKPFDFML